ncbi:DEAD/DEAH box helicase [Micrococcus luteus]|uniref:DEAD/DEAH box helicase family protein n=1 Tax=Micrococcus yunnanensis TaxID=566027 RepID=A0AAP5TBS4_9MICC|nr:DEAD/DEAH box helicase family protein [Micrococcus yunnanensis]MDV7177755.1 DEAD/DEAH box helicase family protein [Micrococcus yunnanensis]
MRYTLKDYQAQAVEQVLNRLHRARKNYQDDGVLSQFSLAAATGAGKTVMAAAIIEALFFGSDQYTEDIAPDPGATVLWFSDDPDLNDQSRARIHAASSELDGRLRTVENSFAETTFAPGQVYFLNAQKLREGARLVRGAVDPSGPDTPVMAAPDMAQRTIYDVIANTVATPGRTLYFILDEAHRGMKTTKKNDQERATIVQRLINGTVLAPAMPIVLGISATVERFTQAMAHATDRDALSPVQVDPALVQASGLLKDDVVLTIPEEAGVFDTTLLREAVARTKASTRAWAAYAAEQGETNPVVPLLVVQVADKPSDEHLSRILDVIHQEWPELRPQNINHVFGTHTDRHLPGQIVNYIAPQRVQETTHIRVLLAMEAISTGWDCPRAEVLMSFRTYKDATYVHQLLGRMVRTPLARRIPGDEVLNSIDCFLPHFDKATSTAIAQTLMRGQSEMDDTTWDPTGRASRRVLFDPVVLTPNPAIGDPVWEVFDSLPTMSIPPGTTKPLKRLDILANALSNDGLLPGAVKTAEQAMCMVLDGRQVQYSEQIAAARKDVLTLSAQRMYGRLGTEELTSTSLELLADDRAIEEAAAAAARTLTGWIAGAYIDHIVPEDEEDLDLREGDIIIASLARTPEVVADLEAEADKLVQNWLDKHRVQILGLNDERQAVYNNVQDTARRPERKDLARPKRPHADRQRRLPDGTACSLPTRPLHLMATEDGTIPVDLNTWETLVLDRESAEPSFRGWYRNPSRTVTDSLAIAYQDGAGQWQALRPDFLFFHANQDGTIRADIVDPHGTHLADALPKLRGLAEYAQAHGDAFGRIEAVAEIDGQLRVLDMKNDVVQAGVHAAQDAESLYKAAPAY